MPLELDNVNARNAPENVARLLDDADAPAQVAGIVIDDGLMQLFGNLQFPPLDRIGYILRDVPDPERQRLAVEQGPVSGHHIHTARTGTDKRLDSPRLI